MNTQARRRSHGWLWWSAGGLAAVVAVSGVLVLAYVWGVRTLANRYAHGGFSCMPKDLPKYPGAITEGVSYNWPMPTVRGDTTECGETLLTSDSPAKVADFYSTRLQQGDWQVTASNQSGFEIDFRRRSKPSTAGTMTIGESGKQVQISVILNYR